MNPFRTFSRLAVFLMAFLIIGLLAMGWWVITAPGRESAAKAGQVIAQGQTAAGRDAVGITAADAKADAATANINRENENDIRNAPGADARVDPALAAAGRRGLCRYEAYRNRPECL
ncbi:hypothetical protein [Brevundimonas sp. Root1423]|uniref:hypothetical protein n=1 Tax=Brevundimonas sp. Root1423 TaxID=1736462 RepID=UPI0006FE46C8|nr:hypothetical protein [Brevundimonas sp. Root1423]KQY96399.1 hypothetical protein ASD25_00475 [Brevundimonas sp. Root1423]